MPEMSRFFGIVIQIFSNDHAPPHFHAEYGEDEVLLEIETLAVSRGWLPARALGMVLEWAAYTGTNSAKIGNWHAMDGFRTRSLRSAEEDNMTSFIRIKEATPIGAFRLRLVLTNGAVVERDISALLHGPIFEPLRRNPEMFRDLRVEGGTVVWGNGADLCPDVLIWGGPPPKPGDTAPVPDILQVPPLALPLA